MSADLYNFSGSRHATKNAGRYWRHWKRRGCLFPTWCFSPRRRCPLLQYQAQERGRQHPRLEFVQTSLRKHGALTVQRRLLF